MDASAEPLAPLGTRLRRRAVDPSMLANPPVAIAFCVLRAFGLIAPLPYWELVVLVGVGALASWLSSALWGDPRRSWHIPAYVATSTGVTALVAYATGWGPILAIGFVFVAGSSLQLFGARAVGWSIALTAFWMSLAEIGIALGIVPTLIRQPLIHGLAGLSLLGTLLTISLLGRVSRAREDVETELRQSERRFKALVTHATDVIIVVDLEGRLRYVSPAFERLIGVRPEPDTEHVFASLIHPDDLAQVRADVATMLETPGGTVRAELRMRDSTGGWRHFETLITNRLDDPDVQGIVGNLHDISDLLEAHERFRSAFGDAPIGMALCTMDGTILRANRAFGEIVGREPSELVGRGVTSVTHPVDVDRTEAALAGLAAGADGFELEKRYLHARGHEVWVSVHVSCVRDAADQVRYLIAQVQDVTEQRRMREHLSHAALHDPLTGLPNRALFVDRLEMALARAERTGTTVAVGFLDLDRFKLVNDALGHAPGDELLQLVAARLRGAVGEQATVARFGGDEFTVLMEELDDPAEACLAAERLLEELQRPFDLDGAPVFVSGSIGVALAEGGGATAASMLRDADAAMYVAKDAGRGRVEVFDGKSHAVALESLHVINELHSALAAGEFLLHYQPIVDLTSGAAVAVEALVRWAHPRRGLLAPGHFVPLAEECGLIVPIGAWVLHSACRQAALWTAARTALGLDPLEMHVNISPRQLSAPDFLDTVSSALTGSGIEPRLLCLEITEGTLMHDEDAAVASLRALRALGVRISIDDFGTGYSSLSYLKRFPIDSLKVDRSFVDGLGEEAGDSVIVSAVVALAHSLGMVAVAEGVETPVALDELRRLGCDRVQGYLLGRPAPAEALDAALLGQFTAAPLHRRPTAVEI